MKEHKLLTYIIFACIASLVLPVKADDVTCNEDIIGLEFECDERGGNTVTFCCNERYDGIYTHCCWYTPTWSLWYFWFGLIFGVMLIACLVGAMCRFCKSASRSRRSDQVTNASRQTNQFVAVVAHATAPMSEIESYTKARLEDAPPSYQAIFDPNSQAYQNTSSSAGENLGSAMSYLDPNVNPQTTVSSPPSAPAPDEADTPPAYSNPACQQDESNQHS